VTVTTELRLPAALAHQESLLDSPSRYKVACQGRRWGKTMCGLIAVIDGHGPMTTDGRHLRRGAVDGAHIWWVVPYYLIAYEVWEALKKACRGSMVRIKEQDKRAIFPNGGSIVVRSAEDPENLVAAGIDGLVMDEAAKMRPEAWPYVRPTLADREGWALFIGTPKGMNWFHDLYQYGRMAHESDPESWEVWQRPTWDNPRIPSTEIEVMRSDMGPLEFAQEIEAQFVVAGKGMFKPEWLRYWEHIDADSYALRGANGDPVRVTQLREKFLTVDLAASTKQQADFTVISTWGLTPDADLLLLDCDRRHLEGPDIIPAIRASYLRHRCSWIGIESVGMQLAIVQQGAREGLPVRELHPERDKVSRAMTATARMQAGKVFFPRAANWLRDIEMELMGFPEAQHDDFVDTLSYACHALVSEQAMAAFSPLSMTRESPWTGR
jgi:predicted phage terminase large subunit-like protein